MSLADELNEAPGVLARQAGGLGRPLAALVGALRWQAPRLVVTCARGSSAHAATFAKHLIELHAGIPVAAMAPNIASVYRRQLQLDSQLFLAISQSGRSDDLVACAQMARAGGALTAALVNATESPLAAACEFVLPIGAGSERAVAATKSVIASLAALVRLVASWCGDDDLATALDRLPARVAAAGALDWGALVDGIAVAQSLIVIGRGPTLAVAREAALKLKEVADLPAEAFSGAELLHGPVALVSPRYPIVMLLPSDAAVHGMSRLAADLRGKGAALFASGIDEALPALAADHPATDAICLLRSFYGALPGLAARRGVDPERPRHLHKVTRTR